MDIEHDIKVVKIGPDFQKDVDQLGADGWKIFPGVTPVAVYTMFREKNAPAELIPPESVAQGEMHIDDPLVGIIKANGKYERF
jgi:hypothetical protein